MNSDKKGGCRCRERGLYCVSFALQSRVFLLRWNGNHNINQALCLSKDAAKFFRFPITCQVIYLIQRTAHPVASVILPLSASYMAIAARIKPLESRSASGPERQCHAASCARSGRHYQSAWPKACLAYPFRARPVRWQGVRPCIPRRTSGHR